MSIISHVSIEFLRIMSNIYVSQVATIHRYHQKVMTMILFDDTEIDKILRNISYEV